MTKRAHRHHDDTDLATITVPVPRFPGMDWPGTDSVAQVPAVLLLAARGRCTCSDCCTSLAAVVRRSQLHVV